MNDQTEPVWLTDNTPGELGTGMLYFRDASAPAGQKQYIRNITYQGCKLRSTSARAMKWIPHRIATLEEVTQGGCTPGEIID